MKKSFIIALAAVGLFIFSGGAAFAQNQTALPSAGLTPESPFYFLDKLGETLREFFTFNPEGKARLQITFAAERVAEIKIILETKGVEARGLEIAQSRLQANLAKAATIVAKQKADGKDVSALSKELDDEFEGPKTALEQSFKKQERALEAQEKDLKTKIREARLAGDAAQVDTLLLELASVKAEKEKLEMKEEEHEEALEAEQEKIEREMEDKAEAEKAIREAEEEKQEVIDEAAEEGITVPAEAFEKFDRLLTQAKELFGRGNYQGAEQLAEQAEKSLDKIDNAIEELEDAKEKEENLKEEQEEKEREAKEEQEEKIKKETENEAEQLEEERNKAEKETRKAEEKLREAGNKNED